MILFVTQLVAIGYLMIEKKKKKYQLKLNMMKTIQTKVLIVVFMLGSFVNYANNDLDFNKIINAKKVKVAFKNVKKGHQLTLKNEKGVKLHSETVSITGLLTKVFDLSSLKNGIYTIELNKDYEIIVKTLLLALFARIMELMI